VINQNETKKEKRNRKITRATLIAMLLAACAVFLLFVGIKAQTSKLKYDINQLNKEIAETQKDITKLEVQIKSASNISNIEVKALEMGMIYPDVDQIIYLQGESDIQEFASVLMESVYK